VTFKGQFERSLSAEKQPAKFCTQRKLSQDGPEMLCTQGGRRRRRKHTYTDLCLPKSWHFDTDVCHCFLRKL